MGTRIEKQERGKSWGVPLYDEEYGTIVDDVGNGFFFGTLAGIPFHFLKSLFGAPSSTLPSKLRAGMYAASAKGPRVGGLGALIHFGFGFPNYVCSYLREREILKSHFFFKYSGYAFVNGYMYARKGFRAGVLTSLFSLPYVQLFCIIVDYTVNLPHMQHLYHYYHRHCLQPLTAPSTPISRMVDMGNIHKPMLDKGIGDHSIFHKALLENINYKRSLCLGSHERR